MKPESSSPQLPAPKSRFRRLYRVLLGGVVVLVTVVFIFPLIFEPGVEPPAEVQYGTPSSIPVLISNHDVTPLMDVEYSCEISQLILANGSPITDAKVLVRGTVRKISGRHAMMVRCETAYIVTAPVKAAEYKLTLAYRTYPWRKRRTSVYRIAAQINGSGEVTGWKSNSGVE